MNKTEVTIEQLAVMLDGRDYRKRIKRKLLKLAEKSGLVIVEFYPFEVVFQTDVSKYDIGYSLFYDMAKRWKWFFNGHCVTWWDRFPGIHETFGVKLDFPCSKFEIKCNGYPRCYGIVFEVTELGGIKN